MDPYLASLALFSFAFAPRGWALCNGQLLPINQNQALFALLGTTFGGDGRTTFALPDLRGRVALHPGNGHPMGESGGQAAIALASAHLPAHVHGLTLQPPCNRDAGTTADPTGNYPAATAAASYGAPAQVNMGAAAAGPAAGSTGSAGGGQPLSVLQPYLVLNYCIALQGIFPSRN